MALTRCLIIKNALNPKFEFFAKPFYALLSMFIAFVLSTIMTLLFWSRYELVEVKAWTPPVNCIGFPPGYTVPRYKSSMDDAWLLKPMLSLQIFSVIDGLIKIIPTLMFPILTVILVRELKKAADSRKKASVGSEKHEENSKSHQATKLVILMTITYMAAEGPLGIIYVVQGFIIPTLMFPILTVILVRELKKAADSRKKASVGSEKHEENSKSHQATKLVILMTITYMAAEGPLGIIYVVQGFVTQPPGIVEMTMDLIDIFGVFVSINAIMHCVIYLTVSSQYQKSAKSLFCCVKCLAERKTKPVLIL
ncbi:Protein CBR-SRW-69 [Caenorhabditis briggsae]|uniref:Protein CBR-SRW-69 n=1 Tax=Caenorhabditis briggsae TaxID=6238 RepID=A8XQ62_CAEBR|nr:Protein CBR-SRW-69 [Caenorhabditis briggsae]CAP34788.2 Protein CBR-SRW-69 [Caenorhabditis briggsae]